MLKIVDHDNCVNSEIGKSTLDEWSQHRSFADSICSQAGMQPYEPLWGLSLDDLQRDFLSSSIKALIVAVSERLGKKYLGCMLDENLFSQFSAKGIHPFGERGEYHTLAVDAPQFAKPLMVELGSVTYRDGYYFLDLGLMSEISE